MSRKACKRVVRRLVAPTCVAMHLNPEVSLQERGAVMALRGRWHLLRRGWKLIVSNGVVAVALTL